MNSQISHSSQTAPIREYRVMWTSQKKQKLKKWHDGILRFHTFNNRMLLYDQGRGLVTDKYHKPDTPIEEGDEFEFEQHLVTVEEFLQTVIQDLTPVFAPVIQRQQQRAADAVQNAMSPMRTPASRMSVPTPRRPTYGAPMRLQTPQSYQCQSASRRPPQSPASTTPAPIYRISTPLPSLPNTPLQQPAPPYPHHTRSSARPVSRKYPTPRSDVRPPPQLAPPVQGTPQPVSPIQRSLPSPQFSSPLRPFPIDTRSPFGDHPREETLRSRPLQPPQPAFQRPQIQPQPSRGPLSTRQSTGRPPTARSPSQDSQQRSNGNTDARLLREGIRASITPEPNILRLSDPHKKRNKLLCARKPQVQEPTPKPSLPPHKRQLQEQPARLAPPEPPQKRPRVSPIPATAVAVGSDLDSDSDPFKLLLTPKPAPKVPSARGKDIGLGKGTRVEKDESKGKTTTLPPPSLQP